MVHSGTCILANLRVTFDLYRGHKGTIWSLATYGDRLFSSSSDGTIKVWDIADLRRGCLKTIPAHKEAVRRASERERERERERDRERERQRQRERGFNSLSITDHVISCWTRYSL